MIIDDYIEYSKTYKKKYGDMCIVLMQVGSFYEIYSISDDMKNDIYKITDICNIQISRKNKSINEVSINNPLMAGFPLYTIAKYTQLLLNNNFTIVLVEQVTEPPNPERKVTEILSPGMNYSITSKNSNYMMVLYFEFINKYLVAGISGIDLSTGKTFAYEAGSTKEDPEFANDETFRLINSYNPSEILIISNNKIDECEKEYILKNLNLNNTLTHYKWNNWENLDIVKKLVFQKGILEKSFSSKKSSLSIIEVLNLEKYDISRISFCCLLQFAYEHNADIIKELQEPDIIENNKHLTIEFNSAVQLNILGVNKGDKPLIDIINRCCTSFGSRSFKERLLQPIIDSEELNKSYDNIEMLLKDNIYKKVCSKLLNIIDLERIQRKMIINKITPIEWSYFHNSLKSAKDIFNMLKSVISFEELNVNEQDFEKLINDYINIFDIEEICKYNLTEKTYIGKFFLEGVFENIDNMVSEYNTSYKKIEDICDKINNIGKNDTTNCKIENNDRDGYYISITKKRFETASAIDKSYMMSFTKKTLATSNNYKITNNELVDESANINKYIHLIYANVLEEYQKFVKKYISENGQIIEKVIKYLSNIDFISCCARNAHEYCYYRPTIRDTEKGSYIKAENMRHPIIEYIDDSLPYIGNDVHICENGILLYGINASGKSSFMKAIGLNIIMAQSGMFVASTKFEYQPYHHIFTRISGMDNIYKGMSSFTVEMTELRNILQRCNKNSLVIGDEICCGTESISALAIVASGIDTLIKKKASFIFATHLHELTDLSLIKRYIDTNNIRINHMHIHTDCNNRIIYDRKLQEGQGSSVYGLEVCKSLDMPNDFMKIAEQTRKEVNKLNTLIISKKQSVYNSKLIVDVCGVCGDKATDTHHIKYQSKADKEGYFEEFHKNNKHNLVPLCKECHKKEHNGTLNIKGYIKTSDGILLDYE